MIKLSLSLSFKIKFHTNNCNPFLEISKRIIYLSSDIIENNIWIIEQSSSENKKEKIFTDQSFSKTISFFVELLYSFFSKTSKFEYKRRKESTIENKNSVNFHLYYTF